MARRSLKPQLNQIRTWVHQGRTNAWIAHQLEVSVRDIDAFKREHELVPAEQLEDTPDDPFGPRVDEEEPDLRAEDDALVAAALDAEPEEEIEAESAEGEEKPKRRRGRRGGRGRRPGGGGGVGAGAGRAGVGRTSRSREPSTTATRATACGSTRPCRTTPCTPSTGR